MHEKGLVLQQVKFDTAPMLVCEGCGEVIRDYGLAWVMWDAKKLKDGQTVRPVVLCKPKINGCNSKPEYLDFASMEMRDFLINLCRNSGMKTENDVNEAFAFTEMMDRI